MKQLEEGQIVLCTVTKILGTIVFVKLDEYGDKEGTITFSEVSPGRIRNIRDYVVPNKKIVCRVLKANSGTIHLSLRRVKLKEKNEFNEEIRKEKSYRALIKSIVGETSEKIAQEIKENEGSLVDFLEQAKENEKSLEKYLPKEKVAELARILREKKQKETIIKKGFSLTNKGPEGIKIIKNIIKQATEDCKDCESTYVAAGKYLLKIKTKDLKQADTSLQKIIDAIETLSKKNNCQFSVAK